MLLSVGKCYLMSPLRGPRADELNITLFHGGAELESQVSGPVLHFCCYRFQEHANRIRYYKAVLHSKLISDGRELGSRISCKEH